jgi:nitrous oxidase accessory protein NosD
MHKFLLTCALLACALFLPSHALAAECTEITAPNTVTTPGNFCLSAGYSGSTTTGALIMIDADDVTFDCRGMSLHNTQTNPAANNYAIYLADQRNVRIRNCKISGGWTVGIYATQNNTLANTNTNLQITGNDVSGAYWFGIHAYGTDIEVAHNRISDIGGRGSFAMGIRVGGSVLAGEKRFHVVRDNIISDVVSPVNYGYGIYSNNTDDGVFEGNTIVGTLGDNTFFNYGIRIASGARNRIVDNDIVGGRDGYAIGIQAQATDKCYHNDLRADYPPLTCDASNGIY